MTTNTTYMSQDWREAAKEFYSLEGIPEEMKQALSFMRQWLNEDRKCEPQVTARDLWHWLEKDFTQLLQKAREDERDAVIEMVLPKVQKFIEKVESGRARSRDTYADMLEIREFLQAKSEGK